MKTKTFKPRWSVLAAALALPSATAVAAAPGAEGDCLKLKTSVEVLRMDRGVRSREVLRLEPVEQIEAGDEVIYTLAVANICKQPVARPVVTYPVPQHMAYAPETAIAPAADVSYSVDGGFHFATSAILQIEIAGEQRIAKPEEYTHLRWSLRRPLQPQAVALVRFHAVVK